jgi:hypothetical protein
VRQELRARHELGDVLSLALRTYTSQFSALFLIALITAPLQMLGIVLTRRIESDETAQGLTALLQIPELIVALAASAALIVAVNDIATGGGAEFGRAIDAALPRILALLTTTLLDALLAAAALLSWPWLALWWLIRRDATIDGARNWWLVLLPLALPVYLLVRWAFHVQAVVLEGRQNWAALDASAAIVRDNWWRTIGILFLTGFIAGAVSAIALVSTGAPPIVEATVTAGVYALILPFAVAAQTILYYDLRARRFSNAGAD